MANKIVSAHGGRWSDQAADLAVPATSTVVFYVADGDSLDNDDGYEILEQLQQGHEPGGHVVEQVSNANTYDYSCWYAADFAAHCGIFEVGSDALVASLAAYDEDNPLLLSQILADYPNCTIYWVACREVSVREEGLRTSPGSFLKAAKPAAV